MCFGLAMSSRGQTGQSEEIHSPDEWHSRVVTLTIPASRSIEVACTAAISCLPRVLRTISRPLDSGAYLKVCSAPLLPSARIVATIDFSGLTSSICALASAAAKLPIELLDCCMAVLSLEQLERNGAGFRAPRTHAMPDRLLRVLRHQALQFGLGFFVLEIGRSRAGKGLSELSPSIG